MIFKAVSWTVILILVLVVLLIMINETAKVNIIKKKDSDFNVIPWFKKINRKNCDTELIYCLDDFTCENVCTSKMASKFRCLNDKCINMTLFNIEEVENVCSAKDGFLAYMVGDTQLGTYNLICKSVDPGIAVNSFDTNGNQYFDNKICIDGKISNIDYTIQYPDIEDCTCPDGMVPVKFGNKAIRKHIKCIPNNLADVFEYNNMI